jgi:hypothetical protein
MSDGCVWASRRRALYDKSIRTAIIPLGIVTNIGFFAYLIDDKVRTFVREFSGQNQAFYLFFLQFHAYQPCPQIQYIFS